METLFVAAFPGIFLQSIDCKKLLRFFGEDNKDKYQIKLQESKNWENQDFVFSFTNNFVKEAYKGYKQKGKEAYERAKSVEFIFTQEYESNLSQVGVLRVKARIPDDLDEDKRKIAQVEVSFQFYHVAKTLFAALQQFERLELMEFKKFYTYLGSDGVEGLARKFSLAVKQTLAEEIERFNRELTEFQEEMGTTRLFQFSVLAKHAVFKRLMEFRSMRIERFITLMERQFFSLFRRIVMHEESMKTPMNFSDEAVSLYKRFAESLDRLHEMFMSQLGISSTFFEVIGLTIGVSSIILTFLSPEISAVLAVLIGMIFSLELISLFLYSTGSMIRGELQRLIMESRIYQGVTP